MKYIVNGIFKAVVQITIFVVSFVLDLIFTLFGDITFPNFSTYAQYLQDFWDLCFQFVGYIRSIFLIDSFSMSLIFSMLILRLSYKPVISIIKMFVGWLSKLKH